MKGDRERRRGEEISSCISENPGVFQDKQHESMNRNLDDCVTMETAREVRGHSPQDVCVFSSKQQV